MLLLFSFMHDANPFANVHSARRLPGAGKQDFFVTFFYSPFIDQYTSLEYTTTGTKTA